MPAIFVNKEPESVSSFLSSKDLIIMQTPRTEFAQALKALENERGLSSEVIIDTIKQAIVAAYKRDARERGGGDEIDELLYDVVIDPVSGSTKIFSYKEGKEDKKEDVTPPDFGRIAAQTAKQVIHQKIREAERSNVIEEFEGRVGSLISGVVLRFDGPAVRVDLSKTEGIMPVEERTSSERLNSGTRMTFLLKEIVDTPRGKEVILSRSDPNFVKKLFEREVPEIGSGTVEIRSIAREAGVRTKMTVVSQTSGIDPVGSCVGQKGVRVQAVTNELGGERVDIIPWTEDMEELIKGALSPAENIEVELNLDVRTAIVKVPEDQLSLAIGRDGQNVRLANKLTAWRIEIVGPDGKTKDKKDVEKLDSEKEANAEEEIEKKGSDDEKGAEQDDNGKEK